MKKTVFDILYALDKDHAKTHRSHTKKINHLCKTLAIYQNERSDKLLVIRPPVCKEPDINLKLVFYSRCLVIDPINNTQMQFVVVIRCKEKQTSRTMLICHTESEVQDCLIKKCKIYDCAIENETTKYSRYILDIIGKLVWEYLRSEREKFKAKVQKHATYETDVRDAELTDLHSLKEIRYCRKKPRKWYTEPIKSGKSDKTMSRAEVRATIKKCMKKAPKKG